MRHTALQALTAANAFDTGLGNAEALLYKVGGVVLLVLGVMIMWASKRGQIATVLSQVAIIAIGLSVVVLGVGSMSAGTAVGTDVLAFFGLA